MGGDGKVDGMDFKAFCVVLAALIIVLCGLRYLGVI